MIYLLFFIVLAIVAIYFLWDVFFTIVSVYQIRKNEESDNPTEYECGFRWKGKYRYGYFFSDEKPSDNSFFHIIGYNPAADAGLLDVYKLKK